jgi:hypothetical protein
MPGSIGRGLSVLELGRGQIVVTHYEARGKPELVTDAETSMRKIIGHGWMFAPYRCDWTELLSYGFVLPTFSPDGLLQVPSRVPSSVRYVVTTVALPCWFLFVLAAIPTGLAWRIDRRRYRTGHCQRCGYNLTGNVSGRCSECGAGFDEVHER